MNELKTLQAKGFKIVSNWQECNSKSIFFLKYSFTTSSLKSLFFEYLT